MKSMHAEGVMESIHADGTLPAKDDIIPALAGFQRRYAVGEKEHVSDCLLLLPPASCLLPDSTLGQKARDLEVPEVFHKFKPLLLMFLMAKKYGTPRGTKILKICI